MKILLIITGGSLVFAIVASLALHNYNSAIVWTAAFVYFCMYNKNELS